MSGLQSIGNTIKTGIAKASDSKSVKWVSKKFADNPEGALATATVSSIILKDGIGCAMYVTQSLNNDKIPEKKRKFVAALDLTNGVLMIGAQIAMFFAMRKYSGPIFKKIFNKSFNAKSKANTISRMRMEDVKNGGHTCKKQTIAKDFDKCENDALALFKFVADIAAATIVGKRIIVPLVATPLAKKVENKLDAKKAQAADAAKPHQQEPAKAEKQEKAPEPAKLDIVSNENSTTTNLLKKYNK